MWGYFIMRSLRRCLFDLGLCLCHCQVDFLAVNELFFPSLSSTLQWKCTWAHAVNKEGKVSHCWVIADVSNPCWETFNFQLCLAFLVSNHYCDKWRFQSKEAVGIFSVRLTHCFWVAVAQSCYFDLHQSWPQKVFRMNRVLQVPV